jgi:parallel beta-helix repeat protein
MLAAVLTILLIVGGAGALEPATGDLNGDGTDSYGTFDPSTAGFTFNGKTVHFGTSTDLPVMGDWDHDGKDEIGVFRPDEGGQSKFYLITRDWATFSDGANAGAADKTIPFGYYPNNIPIAGDWDGDGDDDIGGFNPDNNNFYLYLLNLPSSSATPYAPHPSVSFGTAGDTPIIGDWDGDGDDDAGISRSLDPNPSTNSFYLDLSLTGGQHELGPYIYGNVGDKPVAGDWDGDGDDNIGVYRPSTEQFYTDSNIPPYPMPLYVTVSESPDPVTSGGSSQVTIRVTTTGGTPVSGASVSVSATGGSLSPTSGTTDANGDFKPTYTAPTVTTTQTYTISATASKTGYTSGSGSDAITVRQSGTTLIIVDDDGPANYNTIQAAVNAASTGDTIEVRSGTYVENVDVNKQLTLRGIDTGAGMPVVDAGGRESAITLSADGITLDGFEATNSMYHKEAGIKVISNNNTITGNIVNSNDYMGIYLYLSKNNILSGNTANSNDLNGICLISSSSNVLSSNTANSNNINGILLGSSSDNILIDNVASSNACGITIASSSTNTLTNNLMTENKYNFHVSGESDLHFDNLIDKSNLVDGKPVYYLKENINTVYDSSTNAGTIYCISCINVTIQNINLKNNYAGIFFWNTTNSRIQNVKASDNWRSIYLYYSNNNLMNGNTVNSNFWDGIYLYNSNNNTLKGNTANSNNYYGIGLSSSSNNMLSGNNINSNRYGIGLSSSSNNMLSSNNASNNSLGIMSVSTSSGNILFHNNLENNSNNAKDYSTGTNQWDSGSEGNYYSDYPGTDSDGDGIGDTAYPIPGGSSVDRFPLMAPWTAAPLSGKIAFASFRDGNQEVYVMNADGSGDPIDLTNRPDADDGDPTWSPDGMQIAFSSNRGGNWKTYVMNADGSDQFCLLEDVHNAWGPAWSPDGTKIAVACEMNSSDDDFEIYTVNIQSKALVRVTDNASTDSHPAWSPDSYKIVFTSDRDGDI